MRRFMTLFSASALFVAGSFVGSAQDKTKPANESKEVQQDTKTMTSQGTSKTSTDTINGKIETFEAGKTLKVSVPGKIVTTRSFSLNSKDWTYHVSSGLKAGEWVKVVEKTDAKGHKTLTVQPSSSRS